MKSIARIIACFGAICLLFVAFALPLIKPDSRVEDSIRGEALEAAEMGKFDSVKNAIKRLKMPIYLADANASLAYAYHRAGDSRNRDVALKARPFSWDSYMTRAIVYDLNREPDFMKSMLEFKYLSDIRAIRSDFDRAVPLYLLGAKMGDKGGVYVDEAFEILKKHRESEYKSAAVYRICRLSLDNGKYGDFVRFLPLARTTLDIDMLVFEALCNKELMRVWLKNKDSLKRFEYLKNIGNAAIAAIKKRDETRLKNILVYYPVRYNLKWRYNNFKDFNYPLYAYLAKLVGDEELYKKYLDISKSKELKAKLYGDRDKYENFSKAVFKKLRENSIHMVD